jgi:hypothetical protein
MNNSGIKSFIEQKLREGVSRYDAWKLARDRFPHHIVSWCYVMRIDKKMKFGGSKPKAQSRD